VSDPLTPDEQVRRLLADTRVDQPMPDDVAVRLDAVIADLQGEARRTPAPDELAPRRRGRVVRNLVLAAAAVVVLGVGISRVDLTGEGDGGSADSGAASAPESAARDSEAGGDTSSGLNSLVMGEPIELTSEDFDRQARRLGLDPPPASLGDIPGESSDEDLNDPASGLSWCDDPAWGVGERIPVRYDGHRGVLVLRPASGDSRLTDLYLCGESLPTRSTTVPAG
jgi:hypothetical protein